MKKGQREILRESAASHEELLAELVRQVTWLPLPVARDPLLLRWFDEHYDIWGCAATIPADVAYLRRWHSPDSHPHPSPNPHPHPNPNPNPHPSPHPSPSPCAGTSTRWARRPSRTR